jgi:uncharacterized membrane-anchored protein YhcB (DUF1043 family)
MTFLAGLWAKIQIPLLIAVAIGGAVLMALRQARKDGVNQVLVEQQEKRDELQKHYDEIDSSAPDLNGALERLRERSSGSKRRP